jgi:prevent-host-death family protein
MEIYMDTISATAARTDFFNLVNSVIHGMPKCITTKNGSAVMVSLEDWEGLQETLYIMSDKKLCAEIKDRMKTPVSECADKLDW